MNGRIADLNTVIREASASAGVTYVDLSNAFVGHERCSTDPVEYLNGFSNIEEFILPSTSRRCINHSYHPNIAGQFAFYQTFRQRL